MKKLMIGLVGALAMVAGAEVESQNTVGFTQKEAPQGKFMIFGAGFSQHGGGTEVNGLVYGVEGVDYDDDYTFMSTAAQIQIPASVGYDVYYYLNDGWYEDEEGNDNYKPGWCDTYGVLVETEITPGIAFWFKSVPSDANCVVSGDVSKDSSAEVDCPAGFALRANPFPTAVNINSEKLLVSDAAEVSYDDEYLFMTTAPQIQIPATVGYDVYYYLQDGWYEDEGGNENYKPGWCDTYGVLVDAEIPSGQGIWTKGVSGSFSLTFTK